MRPRVLRQVLLLFLTVVLLGGCKSTEVLESQRLDRAILVDGSESDWQGALIPVEKKDITVGFLNDGSDLYLSLLVQDEDVLRRIMGAGLTVWFDPAGGKEKTLGIRFPLGLLASRGSFGPEGGMRPGGPPQAGNRPDEALNGPAFGESLKELELLRDDGDEQQRFPIEAVAGLSVKASFQNDTFVYELKIPLQADGSQTFAIGVLPGEDVGIGFETPEMERPQMEGRGGRGMPGGGGPPSGGRPGGGGPPSGGMPGGGGMGGRGPGGPGGPGGGFPAQTDPLSAWFRVTLAGS